MACVSVQPMRDIQVWVLFSLDHNMLNEGEAGNYVAHTHTYEHTDSSLLPVAATCFNAITLPHYTSKTTLKQKLELAISYGQQTFLLH